MKKNLFAFSVMFLMAAISALAFKAPSAHADITTGMVAQWKLDDGSGTTAADSSGGGHGGTLVGSPTWVSGKIGTNALSFSAASHQSVSSPNIDLTGTNAISVAMWLNQSAYTNGDEMAFELSNNTNNTTFGAFIDPNASTGNSFEVAVKGDVGYNYALYTRPSAGWHSIVAIFDKSQAANEVNLYVDGALQTPTSRSTSNNTNNFGNLPVYIMSRGASSLWNSGSVDEVRVYNKALTAQDAVDYTNYTGASTGSIAQGQATGWAWSSNIGWISFNSADSGAGGGPYAVSVPSVSGTQNLSGYAWSSNIGWIQFGSLSGFPGSGSNAAINFSTGAVNGWARACAGSAAGDCTATSRSDGWDGWLELSGTNHLSPDFTGNGGVSMNTSTGILTGYAWGGPVVGWVTFSGGGSGVGICLTSSGCGTVTPPVSVSVSCSPSAQTNLSAAGNVTFTASPSGDASGYYYSWNGGPWTASTVPGSNQDVISYGSSGAGPSLSVRDHNNNTSSQAAASPGCGFVSLNTVNSNSLLIAKTGNTAVSSSIPLNPSTNFFLTFSAKLGSDYTCAPVTGTPWDASGWSAFPLTGTSNGDGTNNWSGTTANMNSGATNGTYLFTVRCTSSTNPTQNATATLHIVTTGVNEF